MALKLSCSACSHFSHWAKEPCPFTACLMVNYWQVEGLHNIAPGGAVAVYQRVKHSNGVGQNGWVSGGENQWYGVEPFHDLLECSERLLCVHSNILVSACYLYECSFELQQPPKHAPILLPAQPPLFIGWPSRVTMGTTVERLPWEMWGAA